jgi:hypothetical protein
MAHTTRMRLPRREGRGSSGISGSCCNITFWNGGGVSVCMGVVGKGGGAAVGSDFHHMGHQVFETGPRQRGQCCACVGGEGGRGRSATRRLEHHGHGHKTGTTHLVVLVNPALYLTLPLGVHVRHGPVRGEVVPEGGDVEGAPVGASQLPTAVKGRHTGRWAGCVRNHHAGAHTAGRGWGGGGAGGPPLGSSGGGGRRVRVGTYLQEGLRQGANVVIEQAVGTGAANGKLDHLGFVVQRTAPHRKVVGAGGANR